MKRTAVAVLFALIASLLSGCASVGNGKLDGPVVDAAKNVDNAALIKAAAAGASGDYAKALQEIAKSVQKRESAGDPLAGYSFTRTYFVEGVPTEASKISWRDEWTRTGNAAGQSVPVAANGATNAAEGAANADDDALAGEIADILTDLGLARE